MRIKGGGGHSLYILYIYSFGLENLPISIVKGMVLQIEKYLKKRSSANICSTTPIWLNDAYSISWSKRKWKQNYSKMAAKLN
jgi:hypothetical protein